MAFCHKDFILISEVKRSFLRKILRKFRVNVDVLLYGPVIAGSAAYKKNLGFVKAHEFGR